MLDIAFSGDLGELGLDREPTAISLDDQVDFVVASVGPQLSISAWHTREVLSRLDPQEFENLARIVVAFPVDTYDRQPLELSIDIFPARH